MGAGRCYTSFEGRQNGYTRRSDQKCKAKFCSAEGSSSGIPTQIIYNTRVTRINEFM